MSEATRSKEATEADDETPVDLVKKDPLRFVKWGVIGVCVLWIAVAGWMTIGNHYLDTGAFGPGEAFGKRYDQKVKDCRGTFSERYDCKSAVIRDRNVRTFYFWSKKVGLTFGPALGIGAAWFVFYLLVERKREAVRRRVRLARKAREAEEERLRQIEEGKLRAEEAKLKKAEKQKQKEEEKKKRDEAADNLYGEDIGTDVAEVEETGLRAMHVLLIDDDKDTVEAVSGELLKAGYRVKAAATSADAFDGFADSTYDLVVADVAADGLGGIAGVRKLRSLRNDVKIIAVTGNIDNITPEKAAMAAQKIGADSVMAKPIDPEILHKTIARICD
jgi:CheY-like chemotaxis protein